MRVVHVTLVLRKQRALNNQVLSDFCPTEECRRDFSASYRRASWSILLRHCLHINCNWKPSHLLHGLISSMPKPSKSLMLRVASVRSCAIAVAAIKPSIDDMPRPLRFACPIKSPQAKATRSSTGMTRCSKRCGRSQASHSVSASRFRPLSIRATPRRISASEMTLRKERSSSSRPNHSRTWSSGCGFVTSDRTLVSSRILTATNHVVRRADAQGLDRRFVGASPSETQQACPCVRSSVAILRQKRQRRLACRFG